MNKHIDTYLATLLADLAQWGIHVSSQRELLYGLQLRLVQGGHSATLNLYYSEKKGVSTVWSLPDEHPLKPALEKICAKPVQPEPQLHSWDCWLGSDEAGKGDYFGALAVAAFAADTATAGELRDLGIRDSKRLKDDQIRHLARELYARYNSRISCIVLKPLKYNEIITDMQTRKQNLNDLLAWQHARALQELFIANPLSQGALVDQFSPQKKVRQYLKKQQFPLPVEERTHAESDPAVAAASVIARYQFLQSREAMEKHYRMKFPLGSGKNVLKPAGEFADKYGWDRLAEIAKLHFITSRSVQQQEIINLE